MKLKKFIKSTLFGGLVVILPITIIAFFIRWVFQLITDLIQPLTNHALKTYQMPEYVADIIIVSLIILVCFVVGLVVQTSIGNYLHRMFDDIFQRITPGYRMIKEVVIQIFGSKETSPFSNSEIAKVRLFGKDCPTEITALVTDRHADGSFTIFMATGPNPTSGNIYHVSAEQVTLCPHIPIDSAMRTIIACGAGSADLFAAKALK